MHEVPTFTAALYIGFRTGYTDYVHSRAEADAVIQEYCDRVGLCVTVTETTFIYKRTAMTPHGRDPGVVVGFINYPRFPSTYDQLRVHAEAIGAALKEKLEQNRVTVAYPDYTKMIGEKT